jgi:trigger factor
MRSHPAGARVIILTTQATRAQPGKFERATTLARGVVMKANLETVSTLERKLNIEVPADEVQAAFDRAFQGLQRHAAVKGFRKGKAPLNTIKSIYGDRVKQDVIQDIIQIHYTSALKEHSLDPINYPTIEFDPLEAGKSFAFTAEFEVRPEVKLLQIEGLPVKKEKFEIPANLLENTLEELRKGHAITLPVLEDRASQMGDIAVIDFKGFVEGKELENGAGEDHELELGSNSFILGFEEGVVGMRVGGNTRLKLAFPEKYPVAELAGKPVEFEVTLKALKKKEQIDLNDEFAKTMGPFETVEDLKKVIAEDYENREAKRIKDDLKNRVMKVLVDRNPVQVPKTLMADQKKALIDDLEKRMQEQGMGHEQFEDYKQKWDSDFEQTASYMIQSSFLVDKLAEEKSLRASADDIEKKLLEYSIQMGIDMARIRDFYGERERRARLAYQITEEKVLEWLLSNAKIEEVSREELEKSEPKNA